jgi:hypothetical protein
MSIEGAGDRHREGRNVSKNRVREWNRMYQSGGMRMDLSDREVFTTGRETI